MKTVIVVTLIYFLFFYSDNDHHLLNATSTLSGLIATKKIVLPNGDQPDTVSTAFSKSSLEINFLPDVTIQLATGDSIQLQKLIDRKKIIFINIWSKNKASCIQDVQTVDSIAELYKNKLLVLGLLDKGTIHQLNKLIKKYHLKNAQGLISADIKKYLNVNEYPYGILFSKSGRLIKSGMSREELLVFLEKNGVLSRAKF